MMRTEPHKEHYATLFGKNISRKGPRNCRSLGYARDDKGESGYLWKVLSAPLPQEITFHRKVALSFVIPSVAEGSAVPRTFLETRDSILKLNCHLARPGVPWDRSVA
jgi:hypothetical protein